MGFLFLHYIFLTARKTCFENLYEKAYETLTLFRKMKMSPTSFSPVASLKVRIKSQNF